MGWSSEYLFGVHVDTPNPPIGQNAPMPSHSRRLKLIAPSASPEEAAALVASLERFMRATAPAPAAETPQGPEPWQRAAILEGVEREAQGELRDPWIGS
jgi:hypothetical protein